MELFRKVILYLITIINFSAYNPEAPALTTKLDFSIPPPPLYPNASLYANPTSLVTVVPSLPSANPYTGNLVAVQPQPDSNAYIPYNTGIQQNLINSAPASAPYGRRGYRGNQRFKPYNMGNRIDPTLCTLLVSFFFKFLYY